MSTKKITTEDLASFRDFENQILSLNSKRVKYKSDEEIESQIKLSVLFENFGTEKTQILMEKMGIKPEDLFNQETFISIYNSLKSQLEN